MVAIEGLPGQQKVLKSVLCPLPRTSEAPVAINDLKRIIADAIGKEHLGLYNLHIAVSGKGAIVRHTDMPRMSMQELQSSIRYEAEKLLPFGLDDCVFDCHILDPDARDKPRMRVLIAAVRKAIVQERVDLLKEIGLTPRLISVDSIVLANAFECAAIKRKEDATVSVLHVGAVRSILNIFSGELLEFTRDIEVGGNNATLAIARGRGVEFQEAERLKEAGDEAVREMVSPMIAVMVREIRSTFNYVSSKMNKTISAIYLSGGGALCPGLREALGSEFGTEASFWDPLTRLELPSNQRIGEPRNGMFAVAAGLAVSE